MNYDYQTYFDGANRFFVENQPHQRYGQSLMNYLWIYSPDLHWDVFYAHCDPFYDDKIVPEFLNFLSNRIDQVNDEATD